MGTNYFLNQPKCDHCGHAPEPLHIGKSSAGWCFSLHVIPEMGLNSLSDWALLYTKAGCTIENEYGAAVTIEEMDNVIVNRHWRDDESQRSSRWYALNHAAPGPNGLARVKIDGVHCIGHGSGTWDLIVGEFS